MAKFFLPLILLLSAAVVAAEPPGIDPSVLVRKEHPCLTDVVSLVREQLVRLRARGGTVRIDALPFLERVLKNSRVKPTEATEIAKLFKKFRDREIPLANIRRLANWLSRYEMAPVTDPVHPVPSHLRTLVCIADDRCSISSRQASYSLFPWQQQLIIVTPVPTPGEPASSFITNFVSSIAMGQAQGMTYEWMRSVHELRTRSLELNDPYAELFLTPDPNSPGAYDYSMSFAAAVMHFHGKLIQAELYEYFHSEEPEKVAINWAHLAHVGYPELLRIQVPDIQEVLRNLGLQDETDFFRVAIAVMDQLDATTSRAATFSN